MKPTLGPALLAGASPREPDSPGAERARSVGPLCTPVSGHDLAFFRLTASEPVLDYPHACGVLLRRLWYAL